MDPKSIVTAGADKHGKILRRMTVSRAMLLSFIVRRPSCSIGLKACGGVHYRAREFGIQDCIERRGQLLAGAAQAARYARLSRALAVKREN